MQDPPAQRALENVGANEDRRIVRHQGHHSPLPVAIDWTRLLIVDDLTDLSVSLLNSSYVHERPTDRAHWDQLKEVIDHRPVAIPIIANGDVLVHEDIQKIKDYTGMS